MLIRMAVGRAIHQANVSHKPQQPNILSRFWWHWEWNVFYIIKTFYVCAHSILVEHILRFYIFAMMLFTFYSLVKWRCNMINDHFHSICSKSKIVLIQDFFLILWLKSSSKHAKKFCVRCIFWSAESDFTSRLICM